MAHYAFTQTSVNIASVDEYGNDTDGYVQRTEASINFTGTGLQWHQGPDDEGAAGIDHIAFPVKTGVRTTYDSNGDSANAFLGFKLVTGDTSFIRKCEEISKESFIAGGPQSFGGDVDAAQSWLQAKGFWTNYSNIADNDANNDAD